MHVHLVIAGASLLIDGIDVVRYLAGDGDLLGRWNWGRIDRASDLLDP